jgi:hypothetical protein
MSLSVGFAIVCFRFALEEVAVTLRCAVAFFFPLTVEGHFFLNLAFYLVFIVAAGAFLDDALVRLFPRGCCPPHYVTFHCGLCLHRCR